MTSCSHLYRIELGVVRFSASLQHFIGPAILGEDLLQERRPKGPSAAKEGRVRMMRASVHRTSGRFSVRLGR